MNIKKIKTWIWENKFYLLLFIIITGFFLYQKINLLSWDFASYVLNAKYWFANGTYFEPMRPPLMPFILGIFSIFGWKAAEYLFVILVSAFFATTVHMFARQQKWRPELLYVLFATPFFLRLALMNGTELLSVSLLLLSIVLFRRENSWGGFTLGLTALARYTYLVFFPLVLLHKKGKKMIHSLLLFAVPIAIWFTFNFITTGNFFTSIADQYANVILFRQDIMMPFSFNDFLLTTNFLLPTLVLGVGIFVWDMIKTKKQFWETHKLSIFMLIFFFYTLWNYMGIALKDERFLFLMVLPIAYFSYLFIDRVIKYFRVKRRRQDTWKLAVTIIAIVLFATSYVISVSENPFYDGSHYRQTISWIKDNNFSQCAISSNEWVPLAYVGKWAEPFPEEDQLPIFVERGELVVLFKYSYEPAYMLNDTFLKDQPLLYNDSRLLIIGTGNNCSTTQPMFDRTFLEQKSILFETRFNVTTNTDPCLIMFHDKLLLEKFCNFVNFEGFKENENRVYLP